MDGYGAPPPHKEFSSGQSLFMWGWGSVPSRAAKLPEPSDYRAGVGGSDKVPESFLQR
jgi:hypothetical protein